MCGTLGTERPNDPSNLQINHEKTQRAITHKKIIFFEKLKKKVVLDHSIRKVIYELQISSGYD